MLELPHSTELSDMLGGAVEYYLFELPHLSSFKLRKIRNLLHSIKLSSLAEIGMLLAVG